MKRIATGAVAVAIQIMAIVGAAEASPAVSLVDPTARIEYGHSDGSARMLLKVDGLDPKALDQADLVGDPHDLDAGGSVVAKFQKPVELLPRGVASRTWLLTMSVRGLPANTTEQHYLSVPVAGADVTLVYSLTNALAGTFSWTVKGLPTITVEPGEPIPISIAMGPLPATGVRVLQAVLTEKTSHRLIAPGGLTLCRPAPTPCNGPELSLKPHEPAPLLLWGDTRAGQYEGSLVLAAIEKPEGETVPLTVNVTSLCYELAGVVTILVGVVFSWFATVYVKGRITRNQLLLPASALSGKLDSLDDLLNKKPAGTSTKNITDKIASVRRALEPAQLEIAGLPGRLPLAWSDPSATGAIERYRAYLQTQSDWVSFLNVLVVYGLQRAWALTPNSPAQTGPIVTATEQIDGLAAAQVVPALPAVQTQIDGFIATLKGALSPQGIVAQTVPTPTPLPTTEQLRMDIARSGLFAWLSIALITSLTGAYILIFAPSAAGFGDPVDFLVCLIWGFGLSAGPQLMQATTSTITTAIGVTR